MSDAVARWSSDELTGGSQGQSWGQRVAFGGLALLYLLLAAVFVAFATTDGAGWLVGTLGLAVVGYAVVQGFHSRVSWSDSGIVFRGAFVTRVFPWESVASAEASGAGGCVLVQPVERHVFPIASPDLQLIRTDILGSRPSPVTRTADALREFRDRMPPPNPDGPRIATRATRPGALGVVWLVVQGLLLVVGVVLIVLE